MQKPFTLAVACALAATLGCGKSDMEKQAEQAARQAEQAAAAATKAAEAGAKAGQAANDTMAKGMEDFAKAMSGMGVRDGFFTDSHIAGEVGEVVLGRAPGRASAAEVTIFKSLGLAVEDVVAADLVLSRAVEQGAGAELTL